MYKIYADGELIYDSTLEDYHIGKGEVTLEADKSGSFVFSLYPDHFYYDRFVELKTVVTVYKDGRIVFRGRVLNTATDYWNNKVLTCEGELGFLQDSIVRPYTFSGDPADLFAQLIAEHNAQVDEFKRFKVGTVTVVDANGYIARANTEYETALSNMTSRLLEDSTGGHLYITHGDDGQDETPTLHWLADFTKVATQGIEFGVNLKNYAKTVKAEDIGTVIIPLGAKVGDGEDAPRLTIKGVNGGKDYVASSAGVALRGWVCKPVTWDDVTDANILLSKAQAYVEQVINLNITAELTAIDLHLLDRSIESYGVCQYIPVSSQPHNFAATMLCNKQTLNLLKPENDTVVLGAAYRTLTSTNARVLTAAARLSGIQSSVSGVSKELVTIVERLDALDHPTFLVNVTDTYGGVTVLLSEAGALTVAGQAVTESGATITAASSDVEVVYTLSRDLGTARKVSFNGVEAGTVSAAGDTVTATTRMANGGTLVVAFASV